MEVTEAIEELLASLSKSDHPVSVATVMGQLAKQSDYDREVLQALRAAWQTWRDERGQGPIPDDFRMSP